MFTLGRGLCKIFAASSTTMESLLLKELDFGLQKRTGPSSGVVASIVLVSPGLECPGVSLVEVCATCLRCHFEVQYLKTFFMNFNKILQTMWNAYFSCSKQTFYIIRLPISYSRSCAFYIFKYTSLYYFFMATKVNRSTKSEFFFTNFKKS